MGKIGKAVKHDFHPRMLKKYTHMYIFPLIFVYFEVILKICTGTSLWEHLIYPLLFGLSFGFFASFITVIFPKKVNRCVSRVILFGTEVIFSIQCLIKRSFQWYLPFGGILAGADNVAGNYLSETFHAFFAGIPAIVLFLLPGIVYVLMEDKYFPVKRFKMKYALRYLGYSVVLMIVSVLFANIGSSGLKYKSQYKFDTATEYFGLITSLCLETKYKIFGNEAAEVFSVEQENEDQIVQDLEKANTAEVKGNNEMQLKLDEADNLDKEVRALNTYVQSLSPSNKNAYTGLFEGKNLICICAEALSDVVIDKELTPTLYRLAHNGFYFSDFYQPTWGGSTMTGEFSFLIGLVPLKQDQSMPDVQDNNLYFTLGNQLQREGYYSAAFHNGTHDYYDRYKTHENLGYETFMAQGNGLEERTHLYPDDETMFKVTMDMCIDQQPFSLYYMTVSGHCVYEENEFTEEHMEHVREVLGSENYDDKTMNYFCYQMELEQAMTYMLEKLEEKGILDDTVICMTSDHYPYGLEDTATFGNDKDYVADLYGYDPEFPWEKDHNSCIIWSGCLENEYKDKACEISTPTYSLDIVPTLSNLFGLEYDSRLLVGRDVFSDQEELVLWNDYSWLTTEGRYDSSSDTFYPNDGSKADENYVERIHNLVNNKISFSAKAINIDYYRALFGDDAEVGKAFDWTKE